MSDILLTHSYFLKFDPKNFKSKMPYMPLGTLYAAAQLQRRGYSVAFFDSMLGESDREIISHLRFHSPRIVVIYDDDFNFLTKMCLSRMREAAFRLSRAARQYGCTVLVHGSDPADHVEEYLKNGAEYVILGEGEATLLELVDKLQNPNNDDFKTVCGIGYRTAGGVIRSPNRELCKDLDSLPFPQRDLCDVEQYRRIWLKYHGYFSMNMVTTRGCPFHCNWCAKPIYGQVYHSRTPENVVEEMMLMSRAYRPDHIWFCDDIFGLKPGWVARFAELVTSKNSIIPYKCLSRADLLLEGDTITALAHSGCESVWIGAESGSQSVLDAMEKGITVDQIYRSTLRLRKAGIRVGFFLQYGYPSETMHDIELTMKMLKECQPDDIGISVSYPLPGTKFYERVKDQLGDKQNWVDSRDLDPMYVAPRSREFYATLHAVTHKRFRIWQGMRYLQNAIAHPGKLERYGLRRIAASGYHALTLPQLLLRLRAQRESTPKGDQPIVHNPAS